MKLIIDAGNAKIESGKLVIECDAGKEFGFKIVSNDEKRLQDDGWVRVTRNNTLTIVRVK